MNTVMTELLQRWPWSIDSSTNQAVLARNVVTISGTDYIALEAEDGSLDFEVADTWVEDHTFFKTKEAALAWWAKENMAEAA